MNIAAILSLVALVYILIWGLIYMLGARKRSWIMAVVRIGITIVSTIISIPVSKAIASSVVGTLAEGLLSELGDTGELFEAMPAGSDGLLTIVSLLLAPIIFIFVFLIIRFIIALIMWIVEKFVPVLKKRSALYLTMPLGALNGILIAMITLVPLCGFLAFGSELLYTVEESDILETKLGQEILSDVEEDDLTEMADALGGQAMVKVVHGTVGKPIFNALTTAKLDMETADGKPVKFNLQKEFCGLVNVVGKFAEALESFDKDEEYTKRDKEALLDVVDTMFESEWISMMMTDVLVGMSQSWLDNESFLGMDRPDLDPALNPTVNCMLEILAEENVETLEEDMRILMDVVSDLMLNHILMDDMGYETLVERLGKDGLLTNLLGKLDESPRLRVLSAELKSLSIRLVTNMLGVDMLNDGQYDELLDDVAASLTDVMELPKAERDAVIIESIQENFRKEGYDVPDDVALEMSDKMIAELGEDGVITSDELKEYMVNHAEEGFTIADDVVPDDIYDEKY